MRKLILNVDYQVNPNISIDLLQDADTIVKNSIN